MLLHVEHDNAVASRKAISVALVVDAVVLPVSQVHSSKVQMN